MTTVGSGGAATEDTAGRSPTDTGHRPVAAVLAACRDTVTPAQRAAIDSLPGSVRHVAGYHLGWWDADGTPVPDGGGKAVRPALALLSAGVAGAGQVQDAVPAAVAVELVHDFSLLHDDVMDRDPTRRHRPTAWSVFGIGPAILAGDALLALAADVLAGSGHPAAGQGVRMLTTTVQELVEGQMSDLAFERRTDVGLAECLDMAEAKTGSLLGCACSLGALFGGGRPDEVARLRRFGRDIGLAFQVVDDLLGIWGDPRTTGKPAGSDLRRRKKSLPVIVALTSGRPAGRELAALYRGDAELSDADVSRAAALVEHAGGRAWCRTKADALVADALDLLPVGGDGTEPAAVSDLHELARLLVRRDR
ncbi:family 2 encapsulin nanocompartment cargo protein polyprenyl transferase [Pseudonocardia xinjiangensis]|uniref:Polyprenyl synthetase family protein n=1 Tax=Pseudonocardia xinjiangensis TaxID=75289 RepID=A0ABX1RF64_9PSEU|nr:family 2 encapsulin nanocompartment cargo protein polyprenyl transferase [Pseudonocardia xinjiangensis]NMH77786.1 polyprenyl synthetase family protein [Pseudonocardia xinjiangensis]